MSWDIADWAYALAPFAFMMGFGADGIGFIEEADSGKIVRCIKYEDFKPVNNCDFQSLDMDITNQWAIEERTVGPNNIIRPIINKSTDYIPVIDGDGRGIVCFYDKLWLSQFIKYRTDTTAELYGVTDVRFEFVFQPVQMERFDYFQHLIDRTRCSNKCYKQNVYDFPCITDCYFKSANEYNDTETVKVKGYIKKDVFFGQSMLSCGLNDEPNNAIAPTIPADQDMTGKHLKRNVWDPKPCWTVCGDVSIEKCDYDKLNNTIKRLQDQVSNLNSKLSDMTTKYVNIRQLTGCDPPKLAKYPHINHNMAYLFDAFKKIINGPSINSQFAAYMREEIAEYSREVPDFSTLEGTRWVENRLDRYVRMSDSTATKSIGLVGICLIMPYIIQAGNSGCFRLFWDNTQGSNAINLLKSLQKEFKYEKYMGAPEYITNYQVLKCSKPALPSQELNPNCPFQKGQAPEKPHTQQPEAGTQEPPEEDQPTAPLGGDGPPPSQTPGHGGVPEGADHSDLPEDSMEHS